MDYFEQICEMTDYQPITTFWRDFTIGEYVSGIAGVQDTFNRIFKEEKDHYIYLTELVMVLNWKIWEKHYEGDQELEKVYYDLWAKADGYACENLKDEELSYFFRTTD